MLELSGIVHDVVSVQTNRAAPARATMWLRPVQRLTPPWLWACMGLLAVVALMVAWLSARQGNVFAPVFAVLETLGLGAAFAAVWKGSQRGERITLDAHALEVAAWPQRRRASYPSGWVRVGLEAGAGRQRLVLRSHGRETEIGAFLTDDERATAAQELRGLLAHFAAGDAV